MVKALYLAALPLAAGWPQVMEMMNEKRDTEPPTRAPLFLSKRPNTSQPPAGFNAAEQYVDVEPGSGHEWVAPGDGDIHGECPGLNAAANHGFIPHNGLVTTPQTIQGLADAYNMGADLALFLAVVSVALAGDPVADTWSIGGAFPAKIPLLTGQPAGIAGTHSRYEGDASIVRGDAYLNGGNVGVFQMRSWDHLYALGEEYTLDMAAAQSDYVTQWSVLNNPYYFSAPLAGLVVPAAHNFVINFISNRSAENPGGVLTCDTLKSFFAVTGDGPGNFVHNPGMERIPFNWYKRPTTNAYNIPEVLNDVFVNNAMYPGIVRFGGNTRTVNSFTGVNLQDLTSGVFNLDTLTEGNNGACFLLQASMAGLPDATDGALGAVGSLLGYATQQLGPLMQKLACPQLADFDNSLFDGLPGASYKAQGQTDANSVL